MEPTSRTSFEDVSLHMSGSSDHSAHQGRLAKPPSGRGGASRASSRDTRLSDTPLLYQHGNQTFSSVALTSPYPRYQPYQPPGSREHGDHFEASKEIHSTVPKKYKEDAEYVSGKTMMRPTLSLGTKSRIELANRVETNFLNATYMGQQTSNWISGDQGATLTLKISGQSAWDFQNWAQDWHNVSDPSLEQIPPPMSQWTVNNAPSPFKVAVNGAWLNSTSRLVPFSTGDRFVNSARLIYPHLGILTTSLGHNEEQTADGNVPKYKTLDERSFELHASAAMPAPIIDTLCVNASRDEISLLKSGSNRTNYETYRHWPASISETYEAWRANQLMSNTSELRDLQAIFNWDFPKNGPPAFSDLDREDFGVASVSFISPSYVAVMPPGVTEEAGGDITMCRINTGMADGCSSTLHRQFGYDRLEVHCVPEDVNEQLLVPDPYSNDTIDWTTLLAVGTTSELGSISALALASTVHPDLDISKAMKPDPDTLQHEAAENSSFLVNGERRPFIAEAVSVYAGAVALAGTEGTSVKHGTPLSNIPDHETFEANVRVSTYRSGGKARRFQYMLFPVFIIICAGSIGCLYFLVWVARFGLRDLTDPETPLDGNLPQDLVDNVDQRFDKKWAIAMNGETGTYYFEPVRRVLSDLEERASSKTAYVQVDSDPTAFEQTGFEAPEERRRREAAAEEFVTLLALSRSRAGANH
ncbi:hypothetical protein KEM56_000554 [Ascosphaera pollenicola]|nr:hypothetical protein KEM56_000554 [Ascosphaera pollenicola]